MLTNADAAGAAVALEREALQEEREGLAARAAAKKGKGKGKEPGRGLPPPPPPPAEEEDLWVELDLAWGEAVLPRRAGGALLLAILLGYLSGGRSCTSNG